MSHCRGLGVNLADTQVLLDRYNSTCIADTITQYSDTMKYLFAEGPETIHTEHVYLHCF